jgi:Rrf2 family nitric oxide-sensitive transcriptional repressor
MISTSAEYSLRAVVCLAADDGTPLTVHRIAAMSRVPAGYLAKVLQQLARAGFVTSQRGLNGGYVLAKAADAITLLDVIQVSDPSRRIATCPLGIPEHGTELCPLHRRLDDAAVTAERALSATTVAELLAQSDTTAAERGCTSACLGIHAGCIHQHHEVPRHD